MSEEQIQQIQLLISENNLLIEKSISKLNNELLRKIGTIMNPTLVVPRTRTRTITPITDDNKCSSVLVSGKNKGSRCSKKASNSGLCTMHHKKIQPVLSKELISDSE